MSNKLSRQTTVLDMFKPKRAETKEKKKDKGKDEGKEGGDQVVVVESDDSGEGVQLVSETRNGCSQKQSCRKRSSEETNNSDLSTSIRLSAAPRARLYRPCSRRRKVEQPPSTTESKKPQQTIATPATTEAEEALLRSLLVHVNSKWEKGGLSAKDALAHVKERYKDYTYRKATCPNLHWEQRYRPRDLSRYKTVNTSGCEHILKWLQGWSANNRTGSSYDSEGEESEVSLGEEGERKRGLLLFGPPGSGKTAAISSLASSLGQSIVEVNSSESRTGITLRKKIMEATQSASGGKVTQRIVVIEEIDACFDEDHGFLSALAQVLRSTKRPILLTSNSTRISPLVLDLVECIEFRMPEVWEIVMHCGLICIAEGVKVDWGDLFEFSKKRRDYRAAVLDLQLGLCSDRCLVSDDDFDDTYNDLGSIAALTISSSAAASRIGVFERLAWLSKIAKIEKMKHECSGKRKRRFYHYLATSPFFFEEKTIETLTSVQI